MMLRSTFIALVVFPLIASAANCKGVDRTLTPTQKIELAAPIEKHLNNQLGKSVGKKTSIAPKDILQMFRFGRWHIVYVNSHISDKPFLFYDSAPNSASRYITAWSGGAALGEGPEVYKWVLSEVPGVPKNLASCFAWYVSEARDQ